MSYYETTFERERGGLPRLSGASLSDINRAQVKRQLLLEMLDRDVAEQPEEDRAELRAIVARIEAQASADWWLRTGGTFANSESALSYAMRDL